MESSSINSYVAYAVPMLHIQFLCCIYSSYVAYTVPILFQCNEINCTRLHCMHHFSTSRSYLCTNIPFIEPVQLSLHQCTISRPHAVIFAPMHHFSTPCSYLCTNAPFLDPVQLSLHHYTISRPHAVIFAPMYHFSTPRSYLNPFWCRAINLSQ